MLDRPDASTLLKSIAGFLAEEVRPRVSDKGLSFRLLIAAQLLETLAIQDRLLPGLEKAALERLSALLPDAAAELPEGLSPTQRLASLESEQVARFRVGSWDGLSTPALLDHLRQSLRDELKIANPRFDPGAEVP
jgi:hypothetical protein